MNFSSALNEFILKQSGRPVMPWCLCCWSMEEIRKDYFPDPAVPFPISQRCGELRMRQSVFIDLDSQSLDSFMLCSNTVNVEGMFIFFSTTDALEQKGLQECLDRSVIPFIAFSCRLPYSFYLYFSCQIIHSFPFTDILLFCMHKLSSHPAVH